MHEQPNIKSYLQLHSIYNFERYLHCYFMEYEVSNTFNIITIVTFLKALLDGKLFDKLFLKVTKNKLVYGIVNRVLYRKLMQKLL